MFHIFDLVETIFEFTFKKKTVEKQVKLTLSMVEHSSSKAKREKKTLWYAHIMPMKWKLLG